MGKFSATNNICKIILEVRMIFFLYLCPDHVGGFQLKRDSAFQSNDWFNMSNSLLVLPLHIKMTVFQICPLNTQLATMQAINISSVLY